MTELFNHLPLSGSGYLQLEDGTTSMVGYQLTVHFDLSTGGGYVFGNEKFICRAAKAVRARLKISPDRCFGVVLGRNDESMVPVVILGLVEALPPSKNPNGG